MDLKIGDRVKYLNDVGGGVVSKIIDKKTVNIKTDDGFEIPILVKELVKIKPKIKTQEQDKNIKQKFKEQYIENEDDVKDKIMSKSDFKKEIEKLTNRDIKEILREKEGSKRKEKIQEKNNSKSKNSLKEVDLHIHELVDDYRRLSNTEMLNIQLKHFYDELENAMINKIKEIVFIHGIGNGVLKFELRKIIDSKYPNMEYCDASFRKYGFGATLIFIREIH